VRDGSAEEEPPEVERAVESGDATGLDDEALSCESVSNFVECCVGFGIGFAERVAFEQADAELFQL